MQAKKFIILKGPGDSGKSKFIEFIASFFNEKAITSIDIFQLGGKYGLYSIVGKRINVSCDLPDGKLNKSAVSIVKMLTGGDLVSAEGKYVNRFTFKNTCKLIFATNHSIEIEGKDAAFVNRALILPFENSIPKEKQDGQLFDRFNSERVAIVRKAISAYRELKRQNYNFSGEELVKNYMPDVVTEESKPYEEVMEEFIYEFCEFTDCDEDFIESERLHTLFHEFCEEKGFLEKDVKATFSRKFL